MTRSKHWLAVAALVGTSACDEIACWWTDHPDEPWSSHQPDRRYRSDDGLFEIVLHPEGEWPPVAGVTSMRIEGHTLAAPQGETAELTVDRPRALEGDLVAELEPVVERLGPMLWSVEQLELDAPGRWLVPLLLEAGEEDDGMELRIEVEEDE